MTSFLELSGLNMWRAATEEKLYIEKGPIKERTENIRINMLFIKCRCFLMRTSLVKINQLKTPQIVVSIRVSVINMLFFLLFQNFTWIMGVCASVRIIAYQPSPLKIVWNLFILSPNKTILRRLTVFQPKLNQKPKTFIWNTMHD